MKKLYFFLLLSILNFTAFAQQHIVEFTVKNKDEIRNLPKYVSVDNYKDGKVTAYLWGDNFDKFKALGYKFTEINYSKDAKVIEMASTIAGMENWDKYPTYDIYLEMMENFAINYPTICKIDTIGTSQRGRLVLAAKISDNVNTTEAEPDFFYTSTMHGDETTGFVLLLRLIDSLLSSYGNVQEITDLINDNAIYINPLANPDGTYYGGNSSVSGAQRTLFNERDPNRDFPYPEHLNSPYSQETQDMMNYADAHNFIVSMNFHGGAEVYNFPWDYWYSSENMHADDAWFRYFGAEYVSNARQINSSYMTSTVSSGVIEGADWYPADGTRQDYMTYYKHCKEVTLELSMTKLLSSDLLCTYWNYNKQALIDYIKTARQGFHGIVKNSNGEPLNAEIKINNFDKDNSWAVTTSETGAYFRPIEPGTYIVTFYSDGFFPITKTITVTDWNSSIIQNITFFPELKITGTVIDAQSGNYLENSKISFINDLTFLNLTNSEGKYSDTIRKGSTKIEVFKSGYHPFIFEKDLQNDTTIDFALLKSNPYNFEIDIPLDFSFSGDADWIRDNTTAFDSSYSLKSGAINDNQTSTLELTANTETGKIFFYKKVSSDTLADSLIFYIDNVKIDAWSGEDDWSLEGFDITAGNHTFKWEYKKDASNSAGNDCAWIDYLDLPTSLPNTYTISFSVKDGSTSNPIEGANVYLIGYGKKVSDASGNASFENIYETTNTDSINYSVTYKGYYDETGYLQILGTTNQVVNMQLYPHNIIKKTSIFKIYPNPAQNFITVETNTNIGNLYIFDLNGKCVSSNKIISNNSIIDVSQLQKGIYILKYIQNNSIQVKKMIKN